MTVCPICNGKGYQFVCDYDGMYDIVCEQCKGKGELDENGKPILTNEEYIKSLNTEQLAEWLVDVTQYCFECGLNTNNCVLCPFGKCIDKGFAMEWLKQPHTD